MKVTSRATTLLCCHTCIDRLCVVCCSSWQLLYTRFSHSLELFSKAFNLMEEQKNEDSEVFAPGAAQYGNFINYYEFNPPSNRLALFQKNSFSDFLFSHSSISSSHQQDKATEDPLICCLDIGCNTGVRLFLHHTSCLLFSLLSLIYLSHFKFTVPFLKDLVII